MPESGHSLFRDIGFSCGVVGRSESVSLLMVSVQTTSAGAQEASVVPASEEQVEAFAAAYIQVSQVNQTFEPQVAAAETEQDRLALFQQAQQQMQEAVQSRGLSLDEFNGIYNQAQADPDLAAQIQTQLQQSAQ